MHTVTIEGIDGTFYEVEASSVSATSRYKTGSGSEIQLYGVEGLSYPFLERSDKYGTSFYAIPSEEVASLEVEPEGFWEK